MFRNCFDGYLLTPSPLARETDPMSCPGDISCSLGPQITTPVKGSLEKTDRTKTAQEQSE